MKMLGSSLPHSEEKCSSTELEDFLLAMQHFANPLEIPVFLNIIVILIYKPRYSLRNIQKNF